MGAYTKLSAINEMLLLSGETPVASLDGSAGVDTSIAEQILDQKTIDVQARGLANNITIRTMTADLQGVVYLTADVMSADTLTPVFSVREDVFKSRITTRGWESGAPYLYNLTDGTKYLTPAQDYEVEVILQVDWEDMDTPVQKDITVQASRTYQMLSQGDGAVDSYLSQLEAFYSAKAKGADTRAKNYNTLFMQNNVFRALNRNVKDDPERFRFWNAPGGG
jgi:sulfur transfer complex TusBCD TusB component (DsrH family)